MSDRKLQVIPLGGLGEFGMNSMAFRYGADIIDPGSERIAAVVDQLLVRGRSSEPASTLIINV